ncbi:hypothetical protein K504DRAFT_447309 [Pleomassaria siparia CBS 279.74]|uniref:Uncharacterized protein n=1 Tax=Pleomassaria siparia CBS 279.74 TaxID=1314801 RepID=A0A6G1K348_9PLEO|nr:hypothetical protein K504DRAFT_447309 [Pleomassaria siparia CBS 279.74]
MCDRVYADWSHQQHSIDHLEEIVRYWFALAMFLQAEDQTLWQRREKDALSYHVKQHYLGPPVKYNLLRRLADYTAQLVTSRISLPSARKTNPMITKLYIFKEIWQSLKRKKGDVDGFEETVQKNREEEVSNILPPPYTEFPSEDHSGDPLPEDNTEFHLEDHSGDPLPEDNTGFPLEDNTEFHLEDHSGDPLPEDNNPYPLLTECAKTSRTIRRDDLFWSLVEIIAVTFSTDCERLKAAIRKVHPTWVHDEDPSSTAVKESRAILAEISALVRNLEKEITHNRWLLVRNKDKYLIEKIVLEPVQDFGLNLDYVLEVVGRYKRVEGCCRLESTLVDY